MTNNQWWRPLLGAVAIANLFWFISFTLSFGSFWIKIGLSAAVLAWIAWILNAGKDILGPLDKKGVLLGLISAAALYGLFEAAYLLSTIWIPSAQERIVRIYGLGEQTPMWLMVLLAFLVTAPSEEYFWRGFIQRRLMERFGGWQGWILGTLVYGSVHIWSFNLMLVAAAFVAGAFWGLLYWRVGKLMPVTISHAIWSTLAFAVAPFT